MKKIIPYVMAAYLALTGCMKEPGREIHKNICYKKVKGITEAVYSGTIQLGPEISNNSEYNVIVRVKYQGDKKIDCNLSLESVDNKTGIACFDEDGDGSWETKCNTRPSSDPKLEELLSSDLDLTAIVNRVVK